MTILVITDLHRDNGVDVGLLDFVLVDSVAASRNFDGTFLDGRAIRHVHRIHNVRQSVYAFRRICHDLV